MRLPKKGFVNNLKKVIEVVNIRDIKNLIENNKITSKEVDKEVLITHGLIKNKRSTVKLIMCREELNLDIKVKVDKYSTNAKRFA